MTYEEKQLPKFNGFEWTQKVFVYNDDKIGHPVDSRVDVLSEKDALDLVNEKLPPSINIDPYNDILRPLSDGAFLEISGIINKVPVIAGFFTKPTILFDRVTIRRIKLVLDSVELSDTTRQSINNILQFLESKLKG